MRKILMLVFGVVFISVFSLLLFDGYSHEQEQVKYSDVLDLKKIEFIIEGEKVLLGTNLQYFGNELAADLNDDGREDLVFLVTNSPGGSGTFFYVVAVLNSEKGYIGSEGYYLGDRISPQNINLDNVLNKDRVVVVNYVDRAGDESMATLPSIGKSVYLKLDTSSMRWNLEVNFEDSTIFTERYSAAIDGVNFVFEHVNYTSYRLIKDGVVSEGELNTERGFGNDEDATVYILNWQKPENSWIQFVRFTNEPNLIYLLDTNRKIVKDSVLRLEL